MASWFGGVHVGWRHVIKPRDLTCHPLGEHPDDKCEKVPFRNRYMLVMELMFLWFLLCVLEA